MTDVSLLDVTLVVALGAHVVLAGVCLLKVVWRGENRIDRLLGADLLMTLTVAVLVLLSMIENEPRYVDVALGLAVAGFASTVALAKFTADDQVF